MVEKSKLLDNQGKPLTQSLFLEIGYNDFAVFTLKDIDYSYKGQTYPSLKRLYLEMEDPTEYAFAQEYLLGWSHWQRLCENKQIRKHIDEWREELEFKLRARAVKEMIKAAPTSYQAAKWLADRGWVSRGAGRPSKAEVEGERKTQARLHEEYGEDVVRLFQRQ